MAAWAVSSPKHSSNMGRRRDVSGEWGCAMDFLRSWARKHTCGSGTNSTQTRSCARRLRCAVRGTPRSHIGAGPDGISPATFRRARKQTSSELPWEGAAKVEREGWQINWLVSGTACFGKSVVDATLYRGRYVNDVLGCRGRERRRARAIGD